MLRGDPPRTAQKARGIAWNIQPSFSGRQTSSTKVSESARIAETRGRAQFAPVVREALDVQVVVLPTACHRRSGEYTVSDDHIGLRDDRRKRIDGAIHAALPIAREEAIVARAPVRLLEQDHGPSA